VRGGDIRGSRRSTARPRVLVVGYGARGRQWERAIRRRRRRLALAGVVDPDEAARRAANAAGLRAWASLEQAIGEASAAAAIVASPPWAHVDQSLALVEARIPALVEKPLALDLGGAARVAAAARRDAVPLLVGQSFRFLPRERAVRKALLELDAPVRASIVSARPRTAAAPHLAEVADGPLWDICLHHLDALRVRVGASPSSVAMRVLGGAGGRAYRIELEWPDGLAVEYTHSEGAPAYFHAEWIEAGRGAIAVADQEVRLLADGSRPRRVSPPRGPAPEQALLEALLEAVAGRPSPALEAAENLATVAIVEAAARSAALGRPVAPAVPAAATGSEPAASAVA